MAIGINDLIEKFGTQDLITDGSTSAVVDEAFSVVADIDTWTNDDDSPDAMVVLKWQYPSGTISAGACFNLYARLLDIDGSTGDENVPDADNGTPIAIIPVDEALSATTDQLTKPINIILNNNKSSQQYEYYFENKTGVTMSAGWEARITPKTVGPHA